MDEKEFMNIVHRVITDVGKIAAFAESNLDSFGMLSMEEYQIILGFVKEYSWYRP